jgi:hypothetical protein
MNSVDSNSSRPKESTPFSKCEKIEDFYKKLNVPSRKTVGFFGGKSFTWYVTDKEQQFQVRCTCSLASLGFGVLRVESRMASEISNQRWFERSSAVDPETSEISMRSPLGLSKHVIRLPTPDKTGNTEKESSFRK